MILGWLWNMVVWVILTIFSCWLFGRVLKIARGERYPSTTPMSAIGILGYFVGGAVGFVKGWTTMPEAIKDMGDPQPYFQHLYRLTLNTAHIAALLGIVIGLIIVLKEGRKTKQH
ncbi:MAG: hypothetical protein NTY61_02490 [Candidatus Parcubacteria bacterium]|nr:hypothetical protein [Candidatus Parcubacteria bacterium]